jgi:hypothetical protein
LIPTLAPTNISKFSLPDEKLRSMKASSSILAVALLVGCTLNSQSQFQRTLVTGGGDTYDTPMQSHPLAWWTHNPLDLDETGDLKIGPHSLTASDYRVAQTIRTLGTIAGHRVIEVLTTIHAGPRVTTFGGPSVDGPPARWKNLLVQTAPNRYQEIYTLQDNWGSYLAGTAGIYGASPDSILGTDDPGTGNGGSCSDAYWWFDKTGPHPVDFTRLQEAVRKAIPKGSTYLGGCANLHPKDNSLDSWVQAGDVKYHACGGLGTVHANYTIRNGVATPGSVSFQADPKP